MLHEMEAIVKKDELQQYNGKEGKPIYISYKGKIYDVSKSKLWKDGVHMNIHEAGEDLTNDLSGAPHGEEVLDKFEQVGILENESEYLYIDKKESLRDLYRKFHPHPTLVHFPIASLFLGALLQFLFLITKTSSFESAAFYSILFATVFQFPAIISGISSWWLNYDSTLTPIFRNKLRYSAILLFMTCFVVIIRLFIGDISFRDDILSLTYNIIIFINVPVVFILGFYGGKITWH